MNTLSNRSTLKKGDLARLLADYAAARSDELLVEDMCLGLGYTAVKLSDGNGGLSYTFREDLGRACGVLRNAGSLIGRRAADFLPWAMSDNLGEAAVGFAVINAIINRGFSAGPNISEAIDCSPEDTVGMIGYFCPLVGKFRRMAGNLYIFERHPEPGEDLLGEEDMAEYLPSCDIIVLSATTLVNHTAEDILAKCTKARDIIMVGATTPMAAEVLRPYGFTALAGTEVSDANQTLRIVAQGGGGMDIGRAGIKLLERI